MEVLKKNVLLVLFILDQKTFEHAREMSEKVCNANSR